MGKLLKVPLETFSRTSINFQGSRTWKIVWVFPTSILSLFLSNSTRNDDHKKRKVHALNRFPDKSHRIKILSRCLKSNCANTKVSLHAMHTLIHANDWKEGIIYESTLFRKGGWIAMRWHCINFPLRKFSTLWASVTNTHGNSWKITFYALFFFFSFKNRKRETFHSSGDLL